ncbi:hypothetical protein B0J13DRAFT_522469 [Dactylonectria estremocensis]|uniref:DUF7907 domain-containing protein n=1 Tax=Dactylonectria estremocensis TaxID=1079267 RepID=A0A9P9F3H8_9HYPO|nr:hypothetical protein B0J13DRAFT_522469 [Dactylonectria estremocensis]
MYFRLLGLLELLGLLSLFGLAIASPVTRATKANYPETQTSKGFKLVVNVTDPSRDFKPSIQNNFVTSIHLGPGLALVGVLEDRGRIFYQNGTEDEHRDNRATIITDGGTPLIPSGLQLKPDADSKTLSTARLDFNYGTRGVQLSCDEDYSFVLPETFIACNESLLYYPGQYYVTIKHASSTRNKDGTTNHNIPKHCAPVRLIPECTELNETPVGSFANHEYALDSRCYKDVSEIEWSRFS